MSHEHNHARAAWMDTTTYLMSVGICECIFYYWNAGSTLQRLNVTKEAISSFIQVWLLRPINITSILLQNVSSISQFLCIKFQKLIFFIIIHNWFHSHILGIIHTDFYKTELYVIYKYCNLINYTCGYVLNGNRLCTCSMDKIESIPGGRRTFYQCIRSVSTQHHE